MYQKFSLEQIRNQKKKFGYTNKELANRSGVPVSTINKVLSGGTKYPRQETLDALVQALDMEHTAVLYESKNAVSMVREPSVVYGMSMQQQKYTIEEYFALPDDRRVELIDGVFYDMAAPSTNHQIVLAELFGVIRDFLKKEKSECRVFVAPYDVQLSQDKTTMVQPDIMIICDKSKYTGSKYCIGAPDFIIEIVSPFSARRDNFKKTAKYEETGVAEYWIVDPMKKRVVVCYFEEPEWINIYTFSDIVQSILFPRLQIDFKEIERQLVDEEVFS
ncbi:MAG: Uma2 family endonuclease [Lachnospiraceae bacterium]|nr:Uma2 family endonuclease [Lachnospiraceae bacterium]